MKRKAILIHSICLSLILLSIVGFIGHLAYDYHQMLLHPDPDTDKFWGLGAFIAVLYFIPVLCFLVELYRTARYFFLHKYKKTPFRNILNIFSLAVYPLSAILLELNRQMEQRSEAFELVCIFFPFAVSLLMRVFSTFWFDCEEANARENEA